MLWQAGLRTQGPHRRQTPSDPRTHTHTHTHNSLQVGESLAPDHLLVVIAKVRLHLALAVGHVVGGLPGMRARGEVRRKEAAWLLARRGEQLTCCNARRGVGVYGTKLLRR